MIQCLAQVEDLISPLCHSLGACFKSDFILSTIFTNLLYVTLLPSTERTRNFFIHQNHAAKKSTQNFEWFSEDAFFITLFYQKLTLTFLLIWSLCNTVGFLFFPILNVNAFIQSSTCIVQRCSLPTALIANSLTDLLPLNHFNVCLTSYCELCVTILYPNDAISVID